MKKFEIEYFPSLEDFRTIKTIVFAPNKEDAETHFLKVLNKDRFIQIVGVKSIQ